MGRERDVMNLEDVKILDVVAGDDELLNVARKAVEDELVDRRDSGISLFGRGNGLVIRSKDGQDSHLIRMGMENAMSIGLKAIVEHVRKNDGK